MIQQKIVATCKKNEPSHDVASDPDNSKKNRYKNIYPCKCTWFAPIYALLWRIKTSLLLINYFLLKF